MSQPIPSAPARPARPDPLLARLRTQIARWRPIGPLLIAEFIVWVGFGALLPIQPLYYSRHGVDLGTLGLIVAAWPAARLVGEPIFGWVADRTARKPMMVIALVVTAIAAPLPLLVSGPLAFIGLRAISGLATAVYDPAARGFIVDATPPERRGEAFGLYGAAQMGGLLLGPAIGGFGTYLVGSDAFVFIFCGIATAAAAIALGALVREGVAPRAGDRIRGDSPGFPGEGVAELTSAPPGALDEATERTGPPTMRNRILLAALVVNIGSFYSAGTYEVTWSLFLQSRGAGLDLIGATFALFGLPILLFSPFAGRWVDRRGSLPFIVVGSLMTALAGVLYTIVPNIILTIPITLFEATGLALLSPALFAVVAAGSPPGRSSTAQGIYGAAGTVGFIVSSVAAGALAVKDLRFPFWSFSAVMLAALVLGLAIGGGRIRGIVPARAAHDRFDTGPDRV